MELPIDPDLFGFVAPRRKPVARQRLVCQVQETERQLDELQQHHRDILDELRRTIESAIETFSMAMVDYQDEDNAGDIDRLVEELDEEIMDAIREARRGVPW